MSYKGSIDEILPRGKGEEGRRCGMRSTAGVGAGYKAVISEQHGGFRKGEAWQGMGPPVEVRRTL